MYASSFPLLRKKYQKTLYKEFLGKENTLAEALRNARKSTEKAGEEEPVCAAYVLYSSPTLMKKDITEKQS